MRNKKIAKWLLAVVLGLWIIISIFFYFQHRIQVETYPIGRYIEFEKFSVLVKNIERYNFDQNGRNYPDYILKLNLPPRIRDAILKTQYFYSFPYHVDNKALNYDINCEVIYDPDVIDAESVGSLIQESFSIALSDNTSSTHRWLVDNRVSQSSSNNILYYTYLEERSPNYYEGLYIINKENGEEYTTQFSKEFKITKYSYSNPISIERQDRSSAIIHNFIWNYYRDGVEVSQLSIHNNYIENFPWDNLNWYEHFNADIYEFSYLGHYMNDNHVFIMKVLDNQDISIIKELEFYMVYKDMRWQIIDVK